MSSAALRGGFAVCFLAVAGFADDTADDRATLIQADVQAHSQELAQALDVLRARSASAAVDCVAHPALCKAPFNCHQGSAEFNVGGSSQPWSFASIATSFASSSARYASEDGHANMNWYCGSQEQFAMLECTAGNLTGYAQLKSQEKPLGEGNAIHRTIHELHHDMLAQYCFNMAHCDDKEVKDGMTMEQGERVCDERYGHDAWTTFTEKDMDAARILNSVAGTLRLDLFTDKGLASLNLGRPSSKVIGKVSCAEGHYHCDIYACKQNYCNDEHYWKKYHHRLPKRT